MKPAGSRANQVQNQSCGLVIHAVSQESNCLLDTGCFDFSGTFALLGPIIAYSLIAKTSLGWRAVYWYLFALEGFSLMLVILFYKPPNFHHKHL